MDARTVMAVFIVLGAMAGVPGESKCSSTGSKRVSFTVASGRNETGHRTITSQLNNKIPLEELETGASQELSMSVYLITKLCDEGEDLTLGTTLVVPKSRPTDYELFPGLGYYKLHLTPLTWEQSRRKCITEGAHLAVINSEAEAKAVGQLLSRAPNVVQDATYSHVAAIGFHDFDTEGHHVTIFGQPLDVAGYSAWGASQPNNANGPQDKDSDCGGVERNGKLNDLPCTSKNAFICEQDL